MELLHAFQTLDEGIKGSLSADQMRQALAKGESFDDEEIAEAIKASYDPDFECILYDAWIHKLLVNCRYMYSYKSFYHPNGDAFKRRGRERYYAGGKLPSGE